MPKENQLLPSFKADLLLLLAAAIWGFAFVAQKAAMDSMGPFSFTAIRFALGATCILPLALREWRRSGAEADLPETLRRGGVLGVFLFLGITLQQVGIVSTTAGNAGFITGLYAVFVPVFGVMFGHRLRCAHLVAGGLALYGLYLLSVGEGLAIREGDLLVLGSAVAWAFHVLLISNLGQQRLSVCFATIQFYICAVLSLCAVPIAGETVTAGIHEAYQAIGYAGVISVAGGYTLQVVAQREAHPAYASVILSLEAVFAVIGGYVFLAERIPLRGLIGAGLMLVAMVVASFGGRTVSEGPGGAVRTPPG